MITVNQDHEHTELTAGELYEWEFNFSRNPLYGLDSIITVSLNVNKLMNILVFLSEHLKNEIIQVNLVTKDGHHEAEAVVTRGSITYLNGLSDLYNREDVPQY